MDLGKGLLTDEEIAVLEILTDEQIKDLMGEANLEAGLRIARAQLRKIMGFFELWGRAGLKGWLAGGR